MKYVIVIPDGCADEPIEALGGKTPLQAATLPNMDAIAKRGSLALSNNTPPQYPAGSEVANLCLFGYDPDQYFTGRAPLEAAAGGITLGPHDFAVRCNLVTIEDQVMIDFTADHISTEEATELLNAAGEALLGDYGGRFEFVPGVSYRNLLIYRGDANTPAPFSGETRSRAPHDITDLPITDDFPRGPGSDLLVKLMNGSAEVFADHPVNQKRVAAGKRPATNVWLWGLGGAPSMPSFEDRFGVKGVMITAVDLLRGIAALAGWPRIEVEGATGYLDTDYAAKGQAACKALDEYDLVCVHIEAPDEASHEGRHDAKIEALQQIDTHIVGPLVEALNRHGEHRILVMPDHPTYCSTKKHTHGMVPLVMAGDGIEPDTQTTYDEVAAEAAGTRFEKGWDLMGEFIAPAKVTS
ncbi:cofactor-independent phosphoglycerate mutase [Rhodopirellula sp. MGV]|uniref:cofactor-independent phosphoglycerate mutase n=1 Tax=Rhodopirellula sp. MGV TaxID=2023130 RepID=UPI000B961D94|nr:cofactor-independent phosphoglycerate mutase [Rhodopirellula sp. MGV]OYP34746.1 cofactor-independent phosphoglycerate mutase [Rhodopirellula sp. MGV]PNY34299.1 cofactor-independent phosphoglycerate mutase [Rhodopirellula baltica]